jgi:hypothetical protein
MHIWPGILSYSLSDEGPPFWLMDSRLQKQHFFFSDLRVLEVFGNCEIQPDRTGIGEDKNHRTQVLVIFILPIL